MGYPVFKAPVVCGCVANPGLSQLQNVRGFWLRSVASTYRLLLDTLVLKGKSSFVRLPLPQMKTDT